MNETLLLKRDIASLKRQNEDLKDLLHDVAPILERSKNDFGVTDSEVLAKINAITKGARYNAGEWDFSDKNGEQ